MPELPEVETVRRGLAAHIIGARATTVKLMRHNLRLPLPVHMQKTLPGRLLKNITRRAKYLLFHFDDEQVLLVHLGMSGRMTLSKKKPQALLKHDHVIIGWKKNTEEFTLTFNDARRFGLMLLTHEKELATHPLLKGLGPEPLSEKWTGTQLYRLLKESSAPVKSVIMDQRKLVGVGNIYACEALFRARIRPSRAANKVTKSEAVKLAGAVKRVLNEAIESGGSTLRDYVRSSGDSGYFQHQFKVYSRQKKPCLVCGNPVSVTRQAGRSTFFCKHCQK